jgi:hypothetical protein
VKVTAAPGKRAQSGSGGLTIPRKAIIRLQTGKAHGTLTPRNVHRDGNAKEHLVRLVVVVPSETVDVPEDVPLVAFGARHLFCKWHPFRERWHPT